MHTGPVVAGIGGGRRGSSATSGGDTVNTAGRMESSGKLSLVNLSEATFALIKGSPVLAFTQRGKVLTKEKGELTMCLVERT
ncbi:MAG: hypothetical protein KDB88_00380 [Flavobacteriales bacterium]|nr:hypothetical protein [Flavobacteriales bacterium]